MRGEEKTARVLADFMGFATRKIPDTECPFCHRHLLPVVSADGTLALACDCDTWEMTEQEFRLRHLNEFKEN